MPLITRHHVLLVTLLLYNAAANEALPIFFDDLMPTPYAVGLSVTMVHIYITHTKTRGPLLTSSQWGT